MSAPPTPHDLALALVQEVTAALSSLPGSHHFEVVRLAVSYLVVYAAHTLAWSPDRMADYVRDVLVAAEESTGASATGRRGASS